MEHKELTRSTTAESEIRKAIDFDAELSYIQQIKGAMGELHIKGSDAQTLVNITNALDILANSINDKAKKLK